MSPAPARITRRIRGVDGAPIGPIESYQTAVFTAPSDAVDALVAAARSS